MSFGHWEIAVMWNVWLIGFYWNTSVIAFKLGPLHICYWKAVIAWRDKY